jgi:hypothetical protein
MLQKFLERLGKTTGVTYTQAEFKQIIKEALAVKDAKAEEVKKEEEPSDKKNK